MNISRLAIGIAAVGLAACEVTVDDGSSDNQQQNEAAAPPAQPDPIARQRAEAQRGLENLRVLVDISDRKVRLFNGDQLMAQHDATVGSKEWPTPTGQWAFHRVDINPEWIPPKEEEWAKDEETKAPGDPENPMGRARLVYRMPNTIHGTTDTDSLGTATSHGSIRVANPIALQMAELFLKAGGAYESPQWFQQMVQNRTKEFQIPLEKKIPIVVQQ